MQELSADSDSLPVRSIKVHTLQKLEVLLLYLPAFAKACKDARGGTYVDGMAGAGVDRLENAKPKPLLVWGSPLLALRTRPPIQQFIFMDMNKRNVAALEERSNVFGRRALVRQGDVNVDLAPLVRSEISRSAPCFCFLDPFGPQLKWQTVRNLARLPRARRKVELMILFPLDMALLRLLPVSQPLATKEESRVSEMFATSEWWQTYQARLRGEIEPWTARASYLELYRRDLKALGYKHVISRGVEAWRGAGVQRQPMYHLFFATDDDTGDKIMRDIFKRLVPLDEPVSQQPSLFDA